MVRTIATGSDGRCSGIRDCNLGDVDNVTHGPAYRNRPLDAGLYSFVSIDALSQKVREGGRIINVHALIVAGINADGHRETSAWAWPPPRTASAGRSFCAR